MLIDKNLNTKTINKQAQNNIISLDETINQVTLKPMHWRVWISSAIAIWMGGIGLFIIGIALPLIKQNYSDITPIMEGFLGSNVIIGAIIGSFTLGRLADIYGRKKISLLNTIIITIASFLASLSPNINILSLLLIIIGLGIGADYPICASYIAELMPSRIRGKMLIGAFSFQAIGTLTAAMIGYGVLIIYPYNQAWRFMIGSICLPAIIVSIFRTFIPESPRWCMLHDKQREAMRIISKLSMKSKRQIYEIVTKETTKINERMKQSLPFTAMLKREYIQRTILASVPWFLMDVSLYGICIFTPTIISNILIYNSNINAIMEIEIFSTIASAITYSFLIIGFLINIFLIDKIGRIKLQLAGFIGMFIGLCILAYSTFNTLNPHITKVIIALLGFIIFNLMINIGPNATTFILPTELFPTKLRATAHGFSASIAKLGAVTGTMLLPIMQIYIGLCNAILTISITAILGFIITLIFKVETTGKSLDELSHLEAARTIGHMYKK